MSGVGALDARGFGVWLMTVCRCGGSRGIAAPLPRTPWLLIEICCEPSLFRDLLAGLSMG